MCLLALFFRAVDDAPLVVGANREERHDRPGTPPRLLDGPCRAVAGIDPQGGGTWLGVNEHGVLAAVTNRQRAGAPPNPRSRGLLVRDLLGCPSAAAAVDLATRELGSGRYAGCNIVAADRERAVVLHSGDWLRVWPLPPGLHILTNRDLNDAGDPRLARALAWLGQRDYASSRDCLTALAELCGLPGGADGPPICLHGEDRGTVSSTLVALRPSLARSVYLHAQGPPDETPYEDYSQLLKELADP
jgi:uncharacterized protein with NRDE domain